MPIFLAYRIFSSLSKYDMNKQLYDVTLLQNGIPIYNRLLRYSYQLSAAEPFRSLSLRN